MLSGSRNGNVAILSLFLSLVYHALRYRGLAGFMPEHNEYYLNLARQYLEAGLDHKARDIILTYRRLAPGVADFHIRWAELCSELGMMKQAVESYEQAIRLSPDHAGNMYLYASLLYDVGYFEDAVHYLKKAVKKDPAHKNARRLLADVYVSLGMDGLAAAFRPLNTKESEPLRYFKPAVGHEDTSRFLDLFTGGNPNFALQKVDAVKGSLTYEFYNSPVTRKEVSKHLNGEITIAGFPLGRDNKIKFGIIEIRIRRRVMEFNLKNTGYLIYLGEKALEHARTLAKLANLNNIPAYIVHRVHRGRP